MAKVKTPLRKQNKIDVNNLSKKDLDFLKMDTQKIMKKYNVAKQAVYDRRFALNKKLKASGMIVDTLASTEPKTKRPYKKAAAAKKGRPAKAKPENIPQPVEVEMPESREVMVVTKQLPVIMKPIEINFDNFSIKLNGVPKRISVNPETHDIEIDL